MNAATIAGICGLIIAAGITHKITQLIRWIRRTKPGRHS